MWRDRWIASCLACVTSVAVIALGAVGLGAWSGRFDASVILVLAGFLGLVMRRDWTGRGRTP